MSWGDEKDHRFNFTTFNGDKDKTEARKVQDLIDPLSIRTRVVDNADGSQSIHRMRGGWPTVTTSDVPVRSGDAQYEYVRGYISNIRSSTMDVLNTVWAAIIEKIGTWKKKKFTTLFGPYTVAKTGEKPTSSRDIWAVKQSVLNVFRASAKKTKQLAGATDGVPLVLFPAEQNYVAGTTDADDPHIFLVDNSAIRHAAWRNNNPTVEIYNASELATGSTGYPTMFSAGSVIGLDENKVCFAQTFISNVGNVLTRARTLTLKSAAPYYDLGSLVDHTTQGFVYIFPSGTPNTSSASGTWKNPVPPLDTYVWDEYVKTGGPYPATGTMALIGYRSAAGYAVYPERCLTTTVTYNGNNGYSYSKPVGWFGQDLSVEVLVSVTANHVQESSSGTYGMICPFDVAYAAYGSMTEPPAIKRKWIAVNNTAPTIYAGTLMLIASHGSSLGKTWSSTSQVKAALLGVSLLEMNYTLSGYTTSITGIRYQANNIHPVSGNTAAFAPPENPYAAQWDAQIFCQYGSTLDQYNPGYIMDEVAYSQNTAGTNRVFSGETRDYILFDKINERYAYLKGVFTGAESGSTVELSIVIGVGGSEYEQSMRSVSSSGFSWLFPDEQVWQECRYWNPPSPYSGFTPPFCNQGSCRFVAYSEKHETSGDVFLWSIPLVIQQDPATETAPSLGYVFNPRNFRAVLGFSSITLFAPFWSGFTNTVNIINFADGQFTDWVSGVYPQASQDSTTFSEVYRT